MRFLVVTRNGVVGSYTDIKDAKQKMKPMRGTYGYVEYIRGTNAWNRLIAEFNPIGGGLIRDPHIVGGQNQCPEEGFNKFWNNWDPDICDLMDIAAEFLKLEVQGLSTMNSQYQYKTNKELHFYDI